MKILTWNVNGIRTLKNLKCVLTELGSDITCFQETKITRSQLPENIAIIDGYTSYFSYPRKQSGYSGVATYCKDTLVPEDAEEGLSGVLSGKEDESLRGKLQNFEEIECNFSELDSEGRVVITYHLIKLEDDIRHLAVINVYCPRVDPEKPERHLYKMQFCHLLEAKTKKLCEDGCLVIIVGDLNISCNIIDHCDPGDENEFNSSEARQWLRSFLSSKIAYFNGDIAMVDAFRHLHPDRKEAYTCWNTKISARLTNYGTRIDYILISSNLLSVLAKCDIMPEYEGSDHCPVFAELKCDFICDKAAPLPTICTRSWPEFSGRQQTLQGFLKKTQNLADNLTKISDSNNNNSLNKHSLKAKNKQKSITSFFCNSHAVKETDIVDHVLLSSRQPNSQEDKSAESEFLNCSQNSSDSGASVENASSNSKTAQVSEWKSVLKGPPKPPMCSGHGKPCALRTVKKKGPNFGRQFFMCTQPAGPASNPDANCNFFKWVSAPKINTLK